VNHSLSGSSGLGFDGSSQVGSGVGSDHGFDIGGDTTADRHIVQNGQTMIDS
jgi:hypothetical protein